MGRLFLIHLDGPIYSCKHCNNHLARVDDLESKGFHCRNGRAYLFSTVVNVWEGPLEERHMMTGLHTVADIYCIMCHRVVGWRYEKAHVKKEVYKEGKYILEWAMMTGGDAEDIEQTESRLREENEVLTS